MDERFRALIEDLHDKYTALISMEPVTVQTAPRDAPVGGVYLFTANNQHLYVGRTKRSIRDRLKDHVSTADDCPFAWRLAREATRQMVPSYRKEGSRADLLAQPAFRQAYERAKDNIRQMHVRYVEENRPLQQALLEIYVSVVTGAKHNDFDTH